MRPVQNGRPRSVLDTPRFFSRNMSNDASSVSISGHLSNHMYVFGDAGVDCRRRENSRISRSVILPGWINLDGYINNLCIRMEGLVDGYVKRWCRVTSDEYQMVWCVLINPVSCIHPVSYILYPTSCILYPVSYILYPPIGCVCEKK